MEFMGAWDEDGDELTGDALEAARVQSSTKTVYAYVPAEVVLAVITKHGGQVGGMLPPLMICEILSNGE